MDTSEKMHGPKYGKYILIWLALMMLTVVTVTVAGINFGPLTIATALTVASVKSYLVLTVFMHLSFEQVAFKIFVGVSIVFILITFILLFADYTFM
jgi:cytochrome c oxidase subunit IV